ncbi:MAG TPA: hypothetical protein VGT41_02485 [Candidatus Babeliales bacterium]|nr:hypothetical protein [Candidatus Babeliales bacterium]
MNKAIKNLFLIPLLGLSLFTDTNLIESAPPIYTPKNTEFFFDVDDVILDKSYLTIVGIVLKNSWTCAKALSNWQRFKSALNQKEQIADAWKEWGKNNYPPVEKLITEVQQSKWPNIATVKIVEKLLDKGFTLREATNMGPDEFAEHKKKYPFFQKFKPGKAVSYKFRPIIKKPNPQYFAELTTLAPDTEHKIFVDDKIENVKAARKAGFIGIHFTTAEQLEADLICMGIVISSHPSIGVKKAFSKNQRRNA